MAPEKITATLYRIPFAVATPGHTDGSIGVHLPAAGVLFTGDTAAHVQVGVVPGVFNLDSERTHASFRKLAAIDVEVACFGHGDPIPHGASAAMRAILGG
jgi:glyoxylase-like metal-dependent hydrolase (beta-lactamase superfamily II)